MTELIDSLEGLRTRLGTRATDGEHSTPRRPRVVVMTMGALHDGHLELVRAGRAWLGNRGLGPRDAEFVVTVFVNPLQFSDPSDLAKYPRTLDDDVALCRSEGVDVVFAPSVDEMYPDGDPLITVDPGVLGETLEGISRPGHFRGMLTVVNRLLMVTAPTAAMFGEKDYQQLALIRRMVADLLIPTHIVGVPTVREADGLAMSSRNRRLSARDRAAAIAVPQSLERVRAALESGASAEFAADDASRWLAAQPLVDEVDYLAVRSTQFEAPPRAGEARALVAAVVGGVRLIDNVRVTIPQAR